MPRALHDDFRALFLDRDGVIIENREGYVLSWSDVVFLPDALNALASLRSSPFKIILVTNQSAIGRGLIARSEVDEINRRLLQVIEAHGGRIDAVYLCPHAPEANCQCRKPKPGLLLQASREYALDLKRSVLIGDAVTDLTAGRSAGVGRLVLVRTGRGSAQEALLDGAGLSSAERYDTLGEAIDSL